MKKLLIGTLLVMVLVIAGCGQSETGETEEGTYEENEANKDQTEQDESNTPESDDQEGNESTNETDTDSSNQENEQEEINSETIDKEKAKNVLAEYENTFNEAIENTEGDGKHKEYTTKEEIIEHFQNIMSENRATSMVDTYFEEREDGMYVKAMDGPSFLQEDEEFSFSKNNEGSVSVIQERKNELTGHREIEFELTNNDDKWIVNAIDSRSLESNNE